MVTGVGSGSGLGMPGPVYLFFLQPFLYAHYLFFFMLVILKPCDSCFSFRHHICVQDRKKMGKVEKAKALHYYFCQYILLPFVESKCFLRTAPLVDFIPICFLYLGHLTNHP